MDSCIIDECVCQGRRYLSGKFLNHVILPFHNCLLVLDGSLQDLDLNYNVCDCCRYCLFNCSTDRICNPHLAPDPGLHVLYYPELFPIFYCSSSHYLMLRDERVPLLPWTLGSWFGDSFSARAGATAALTWCSGLPHSPRRLPLPNLRLPIRYELRADGSQLTTYGLQLKGSQGITTKNKKRISILQLYLSNTETDYITRITRQLSFHKLVRNTLSKWT